MVKHAVWLSVTGNSNKEKDYIGKEASDEELRARVLSDITMVAARRIVPI